MRRHALRPSRPRRGIFLADTVIGFALIAILSLALVVAITRAGRARDRLDTQAASTRTARRAITLLQQGAPLPPRMDDADVRVAPAPGGDAIPGHAWMQVTVTRDGRTVMLVGLVPRKEAP